MTAVVVIGAQWGDEGKGKVVDWLADRAEVIVRFQGGHNAGHTLVIDGKTIKLALLPSGIVREGTLSIIGNGVVVDPWALLEEMMRVRETGVNITPEKLLVSDQAPIILPWHAGMDQASELALGAGKIGTTGRGIGPSYEDKVGRRGLRIGDLAQPEYMRERLIALAAVHNAMRKGLGVDPVDAEKIYKDLCELAPQILPYVGRVWQRLDVARKAHKKILFEGAQGFWLDVDHGTYPFVTSSNIVPAQACTGSGFPVHGIGSVLGLVKAYTTRVGSGPFPTEQDNEIGELLGTRGHEFGTNTGRKRRCGWFDAVMSKQAVTVAGLTGLVLTKLDILDGFETLKICTGYRLNGVEIDYMPSHPAEQALVEPIYEEIQGWKGSTQGARRFADLPAEAVKYIRRIEELVECPIQIVSTSPEREDTILMRDPFL